MAPTVDQEVRIHYIDIGELAACIKKRQLKRMPTGIYTDTLFFFSSFFPLFFQSSLALVATLFYIALVSLARKRSHAAACWLFSPNGIEDDKKKLFFISIPIRDDADSSPGTLDKASRVVYVVLSQVINRRRAFGPTRRLIRCWFAPAGAVRGMLLER